MAVEMTIQEYIHKRSEKDSFVDDVDFDYLEFHVFDED